MSLRIGAKLPHTGSSANGAAVRSAAIALEEAGFDSLWVSDHVVLPERVASTYPFSSDGVARWSTDLDYLEALLTLTAAAAVTSRVALGTAVLVLPQRQPVLLAKQAATLDALSGGRLVLGVGAGWLAEEFAALGASFEDRGPRMAEVIGVLRSCWSGRHEGLLVLPRPVGGACGLPVLVGGHSPAALRRAGVIGDGWLAQQAAADLDPDAIAHDAARMRSAAQAAGRDASSLRVVLRVADSLGRLEQVAAHLSDLVAAGVDEVVVDVNPAGDPAGDYGLLRSA
ncbi:probable F420-dependent oxidoreductase, Rv2161c family [Quadrisphaera granulorum]|uniref:Putative F420-dependent oxidoreductase n=1 Tax=Quadrisphaera granulorum TaxID=317664 RepID=A0A316A450_9ACTN|nr:TIGR03619 family F420-dependent LLM class oxidoreductase [Quadrisphaera granulorum]PWJ52756.1 putative F420-dependent oxidoreductase [Quadrisphaera granulorum]SZE97361.1 probable F420-dependent oxidoreductase, Rv2161c family [Quadrisphaera granulorum]